MPLYDYQCPQCGGFDELRPASMAAEPCACPVCGTASPRVIRAPQVLAMDFALRRAHETNERNAHEPKHSTAEERAHKHEHGPGCSCCSTGKLQSKVRYGADGSKHFPGQRPWMISH